MRLQGRITRWDDEKGFGFISWHGDGSTVFVHIKAFTRVSRRPEVGDIVTYVMAKDQHGRSRAENVRFSDQSQAKQRVAGRRTNSSFPVRFAAIFVCALFVAAYLDRISWSVVATYIAISLVTFLAYGWDKSSARRGSHRTPESSLHFLGLVGGWPGALAAQRIFRHKSSKQKFLSVFWFTVLLNVAAACYLVWIGEW